MKAMSVNEFAEYVYMVQTGSKISMDYAGNNMKRNNSMVKYMIYNMGKVNKVCIKKITSYVSFICITQQHIKISSKTSSNAILKFVFFT